MIGILLSNNLGLSQKKRWPLSALEYRTNSCYSVPINNRKILRGSTEYYSMSLVSISLHLFLGKTIIDRNVVHQFDHKIHYNTAITKSYVENEYSKSVSPSRVNYLGIAAWRDGCPCLYIGWRESPTPAILLRSWLNHLLPKGDHRLNGSLLPIPFAFFTGIIK